MELKKKKRKSIKSHSNKGERSSLLYNIVPLNSMDLLNMDLSTLNKKIDALGVSILQWASPVGWPVSPLTNYPLADFRSAFYIAFGYLTFVIIGSVRMFIYWSYPISTNIILIISLFYFTFYSKDNYGCSTL